MLFAWINFIVLQQSSRQQQYNSDSLVTLGQLINNQPKNVQYGNRVGLGTTDRFHIMNNQLVRLTCHLISLVNDKHMDKKILVYVYFWSTVNNQPKNSFRYVTRAFMVYAKETGH